MQRALRLKLITDTVARGRHLSVDALAQLTGVSAVTIRRDLAQLAEEGAIARVHGGAKTANPTGQPMPYTDRMIEHEAEKDRMARATASLIADHESVVMDNGTTCVAVARHVCGRPLTALALSLPVAAALAAQPGVDVVVPGGAVESSTLAFVAAPAISALAQMVADVVVLGACSASPEHGLTSTSFADAQVKRAAIAAARRRVLVATADKLARTSTFRFGSPEDLTHLVTTPDAPDDLLAAYRACGVAVHVAT